MAVLGGVAWFFQQKLPALMLWGGAAMIMFRLNKRAKKSKQEEILKLYFQYWKQIQTNRIIKFLG